MLYLLLNWSIFFQFNLMIFFNEEKRIQEEKIELFLKVLEFFFLMLKIFRSFLSKYRINYKSEGLIYLIIDKFFFF